jgi:nitrate reductase gamma subunit
MTLRIIFGVIIPYAAALIFLAGVVRRVLEWASCPVPFRTPVACGQQKSLPWVKTNRLDNPSTAWGAIGRMALEIFLFRSLFRNTKAELHKGGRLVFCESKFLWLGALAFHWSFLFIVLRHLRFFLDPVPSWIIAAQELDGFFQIGAPALYATDLVVSAALLYLLLRRIIDARIRYISLFADYFVLLLLIGIAGSGILMRYFFKTDLVEIKRLMLGLAHFTPVIPEGVSGLFFVH